MNQFPRMVYRFPGSAVALQHGTCDFSIAQDEDGLALLLADGFHLDPDAAKAAYEAPVVALDPVPVTRAYLEAQAEALGIKVDGRWSDKKLSDAIAAKV